MKRKLKPNNFNRRAKQSFPPGWNEKRVKRVIAYYDRQTPNEAVAEYEAAMQVDGQSIMLVPTNLVTEIRRLIKQRRGA
jgi:hypothetical protein